MDRKRSTLFPLILAAPSGPVATAYYKSPYFVAERQGSRNLDRARAAVLSSEALGARFAELAEPSAISINETLALDPDTLETVTLGLEGRPMGNPLRLAFTSGRRDEALKTCFRVGEAIRIMEGLPSPDHEPGLDRIWQETQRKLESVGALLPDPDRVRLESALVELFGSATNDPAGVTLAHGDLSPNNVIMMKDGTGLIDFMWIPQLRGFDLSRFIHRLRYTTTSYRPWTSALTAAVLDGYGDRNAPSLPGWRFSDLQGLMATVQHLERKGEGGRRSAERALDEIRAGL